MVAAMLGPRVVEGAALRLLRLLLLMLLPSLREPGLGVAGVVGAGLPESVIWAVNAGGEAHVDVHGIHFRKDPLEGRVGRGESPSPALRDSRPAVLGAAGGWLRAQSPFLDSGATSLERSFFAVSSGTWSYAQGLALARSYQEPRSQRVGEKLYLDLASWIFSAPHPHSNWESKDQGCLLPFEARREIGRAHV